MYIAELLSCQVEILKKMQLREIVKKIRERNQWTQRDLAAELQIEQADVQRIETAGRKQIEDEIKMLSAVLDEDKKESVEALRRRISRLKGALEYRGRDDYTLTER